MVAGIMAYPFLEGIRGQKGVFVELLIDQIERLSWLVSDFSILREVDINPLKGFENALFVVDARVIL